MFTKLIKSIAHRFFFRQILVERLKTHRSFLARASELQMQIAVLVHKLEDREDDSTKDLVTLLRSYGVALAMRETMSATVIAHCELAIAMYDAFSIKQDAPEISTVHTDELIQGLQKQISEVGHVGPGALHGLSN